jgi:hypothetical protein
MGDGQTRDVAARLHSASIRLLRTLRREDDGSGLSAPRLSALSWVAVEGPTCKSGDSGAPVFEGQVALGLVKGGTYRADGRQNGFAASGQAGEQADYN